MDVYTTVYTAYTAAYIVVYTSVDTLRVHSRVHGFNTVVYMACSRPVLVDNRLGPLGRVHGGRVHSRVHGYEHGLYTKRLVCETYRICNFLANSCDYIRKQSKAS